MVSMATVNMIHKEGCTYNQIAAVARPRPLSLVSLLSLDISLLSCGKLCKLSNLHIHEFLWKHIKNSLKSINKQLTGPNHHFVTVIALVIYHVTNILMSCTYLKIISHLHVHEY